MQHNILFDIHIFDVISDFLKNIVQYLKGCNNNACPLENFDMTSRL